MPAGLLQVLLYNLVWFLIPIGALLVCIIEPDAARQAVGAIDEWARQHARTIVVAVALGVGSALLIRGLLIV